MARFATTSTPLGANATYTSGVLLSDVFDSITGSVFADQPGTIKIQQTADYDWVAATGHWDLSAEYAITASDGSGFQEDLLLPYFQVLFVNGATPQGLFRLTVRAAAAGNRY